MERCALYITVFNSLHFLCQQQNPLPVEFVKQTKSSLGCLRSARVYHTTNNIKMEPPTPDDMLVAALVIGAALVAFIAVLYLNREGRKKEGRGVVPAADVAEGGTVLVEEGGRVVRRSTR